MITDLASLVASLPRIPIDSGGLIDGVCRAQQKSIAINVSGLTESEISTLTDDEINCIVDDWFNDLPEADRPRLLEAELNRFYEPFFSLARYLFPQKPKPQEIIPPEITHTPPPPEDIISPSPQLPHSMTWDEIFVMGLAGITVSIFIIRGYYDLRQWWLENGFSSSRYKVTTNASREEVLELSKRCFSMSNAKTSRFYEQNHFEGLKGIGETYTRKTNTCFRQGVDQHQKDTSRAAVPCSRSTVDDPKSLL